MSLLVSFLDRKGELLDVWLWLVFNHLIDEGKDVITLDSKQDEGRPGVAVCRGVRASDTSRVNEVLAIVLRDAVLVGVATDQNIAIQLALNRSESLHVTPRDDLVAMDDTNLKVVDLDNFSLGQASNFVAVTLHNVSLTLCGGQILQPLHRLHIQRACLVKNDFYE